MAEKKSFYITTPIFYPNGKPHMGHAYSEVLADCVARYHRLIGDTTYFLTGTDENTAKIPRAAEKVGKEPKEFTDEIVSGFKSFFSDLNISYDQFIRTSDEKAHWPGAQELWRRLEAAGDIYKDTYSGLYCVGAESFVTEKDLVDGKCPDHDELPQKIEEENYFFRLSKYTDPIRKLIESNELLIVPETRKREVLLLLDEGLKDISFSRPIKEVPWGIPVPGDDTQVMYVWCDALTNYISALGFGQEGGDFNTFWPADWHVLGKDIVRFHAAIWPAMLLSAGLPLSKQLLVHGLILSNGRKMSKSLGNVLDPALFIEKYGADAVRYYLAREVSPFDDGDMTEEKFIEAYNGNLANGLGNAVARIITMARSYEVPFGEVAFLSSEEVLAGEHVAPYKKAFEAFRIDEAADYVWSEIACIDGYIAEHEPYKLAKTDMKKTHEHLIFLLKKLWEIAILLEPFLPTTALTIQTALKNGEQPDNLFPRIA
jgi:methionyl-tRNA synthetase